LSVINQLADDPIECTEYHVGHCEVCGKDNISHQSVGHVSQIEKLLQDNFIGDNVEFGVKFIKKSYHRVRSPFLHDGKLSGNEKDGQWSSPRGGQFDRQPATRATATAAPARADSSTVPQGYPSSRS
jgi:hypothetical protein